MGLWNILFGKNKTQLQEAAIAETDFSKSTKLWEQYIGKLKPKDDRDTEAEVIRDDLVRKLSFYPNITDGTVSEYQASAVAELVPMTTLATSVLETSADVLETRISSFYDGDGRVNVHAINNRIGRAIKVTELSRGVSKLVFIFGDETEAVCRELIPRKALLPYVEIEGHAIETAVSRYATVAANIVSKLAQTSLHTYTRIKTGRAGGIKKAFKDSFDDARHIAMYGIYFQGIVEQIERRYGENGSIPVRANEQAKREMESTKTYVQEYINALKDDSSEEHLRGTARRAVELWDEYLRDNAGMQPAFLRHVREMRDKVKTTYELN